MHRRRLLASAVTAIVALTAVACSSGTPAPEVTVTQTEHVPATGSVTQPPAPVGSSTDPQPAAATAATTTSGHPSGAPAAATTGISPTPPPGSKNCTPGDPDSCFTPTKLKPGQKPPQFIVFSFDGVGWHQKWQYYEHIADQVPMRFTGFLDGLYLVDAAHKDAYQAPGHAAGVSSLGPGSWSTQAEVAQEINDLNTAYERGDEIGTILDGHYCGDNPPGGPQWDTAQWTTVLSEFMHFVADYKKVDDDPNLPTLKFGDSEIDGDRMPCLQGKTSVFFPVVKKLGFTYDSSPDRQGLYWPLQDPTTGLWQIGMADWWRAGTEDYQIMMDWNFWYAQEGGSLTEGKAAPPARAKQDGRQMSQTYWNMYNAAYNGNRAPIIIGNHFNDWNHNTYTEAIGNFMLGVCGKPNTYCVPFRDVVRWMNVQSPAVLKSLQGLPPQLPHKGVDDKPVS